MTPQEDNQLELDSLNAKASSMALNKFIAISSISHLPRIWTGCIFSVIALVLPFLHPFLFIYWCFCVYRIHKLLQEVTSGTYPLSARKALVLTALANPLLPGFSSLVSAGIITIIFLVLKSLPVAWFSVGTIIALTISVGIVQLFLIAFCVFGICWYWQMSKAIATFVNERSREPQVSGTMPGIVIGVGMIVPGLLAFLYCPQTITWTYIILWLFTLPAVGFFIAFIALFYLNKKLKLLLLQSDPPSHIELAQERFISTEQNKISPAEPNNL